MSECLQREYKKEKRNRNVLKRNVEVAEQEKKTFRDNYYALKNYKTYYRSYLEERRVTLVAEIFSIIYYVYLALNVTGFFVFIGCCLACFDVVCLRDFFSTLNEKNRRKRELEKLGIDENVDLSKLYDKWEESTKRVRELLSELDLSEKKVCRLKSIVEAPDLASRLELLKDKPELRKAYLEEMFQDYLDEFSIYDVSNVHLSEELVLEESVKKYNRTI
ncbi:MAG: hypothetical protein OSJ65_06795 [Bacilli bacterium]|nr:hypothetical protein [Bacilli bacterium]